MAERTPHINGARMRELRQTRGVKKRGLADRCGVSYGHIDNIEYSRKPASPELANVIARELGVQLDGLLCQQADCASLDQHRVRFALARVRRSA